jgi:hypothetical protein
VMIHRCQILKADLNRDFRFGPLSRASYASPALDNNEFATRAGPNEISSVSSGWFSPSDKPRLLLCNHFLRHCSDSPSSAPEFATAIAMLAARDQQRRDSSEHLAKQPPVQMSLSQQRTVVAGVLDQPSTCLHPCCKLVSDQASMLFGSVPGKSYRPLRFNLYCPQYRGVSNRRKRRLCGSRKI